MVKARDRGTLLVAPSRPGKPPLHPWVLRLAILSTLVAGSALGALNLILIDGSLRVVPEAWVQLHAGWQIFGFAALLVVGVSAFVVPRFWEAPAPRPWAIRLAAAGLFGGMVVLSVGLLLRMKALVVASGCGQFLGSLVFAGVIAGLYRRRQRSRQGLERYLLAGPPKSVARAVLDISYACAE